jgi:hypothetical protein
MHDENVIFASFEISRPAVAFYLILYVGWKFDYLV